MGRRRFEVHPREPEWAARPGEAAVGIEDSLRRFLRPFVAHLARREAREHAERYVAGLVSDLASKTIESIAYRFGRDRHGLQRFIGGSSWDHRPLLGELARQVAAELGEADGIAAVLARVFPKSGGQSVGVGRQRLGPSGREGLGQLGLFLGYGSRRGWALVDFRLYLPPAWAGDATRRRRGGIPGPIRYRTVPELALELLRNAGGALPTAWVAGGPDVGVSSRLRAELRSSGDRYFLAIPPDATVREPAGAEDPTDADAAGLEGRSRPVRDWAERREASAWVPAAMPDRDGGDVATPILRGRVVARTDRHPAAVAETLVAARLPDGRGGVEPAYFLTNGPDKTPPGELARLAGAVPRMESLLREAEAGSGLADYEVRNWPGWQHHQTLALIAAWYRSRSLLPAPARDPRALGGPDDRVRPDPGS